MANRLKKYQVLVTFEAPAAAEFADIREYISTELESNGGSRPPNDPLFYGLREVKISKPIVPWRNPAMKKKVQVRLVAPWEKPA